MAAAPPLAPAAAMAAGAPPPPPAPMRAPVAQMASPGVDNCDDLLGLSGGIDAAMAECKQLDDRGVQKESTLHMVLRTTADALMPQKAKKAKPRDAAKKKLADGPVAVLCSRFSWLEAVAFAHDDDGLTG